MRKFLISAAVAASAFAVASPAAAQYYPQPQGNAYGYYGNQGQARSLLARVDRIRRQIECSTAATDQSNREANRLRAQATDLREPGAQRRLQRPELSRAPRSIEVRIAAWNSGSPRGVYDGNRSATRRYNYGNVGWDRDRDGRDDRYEDDRGTRHD